MIFKVYYQPDKKATPRREHTQSLYLEADSKAAARLLVEGKTNYNIEFIELLDEKALAYEKESRPDFHLTKL